MYNPRRKLNKHTASAPSMNSSATEEIQPSTESASSVVGPDNKFAESDILPAIEPVEPDANEAPGDNESSEDDHVVSMDEQGPMIFSTAEMPANEVAETELDVDQTHPLDVDPAPPIVAAKVPAAESNRRAGRKLLVILAAAASIAAIAVFGAQSWPSASANQTLITNIEAPAANSDPDVATTALQEQATAAAIPLDSGPVRIAPEATPQVVSFTEVITSDSPLVQGKSLEQLIMGSPAFVPIEGLPDSQWRGETCNACHTWDQASLCVQGQFYVKHGLGAVERKKHPYGGAFKQSVMTWASNDCQ